MELTLEDMQRWPEETRVLCDLLLEAGGKVAAEAPEHLADVLYAAGARTSAYGLVLRQIEDGRKWWTSGAYLFDEEERVAWSGLETWDMQQRVFPVALAPVGTWHHEQWTGQWWLEQPAIAYRPAVVTRAKKPRGPVAHALRMEATQASRVPRNVLAAAPLLDGRRRKGW